MLGAELAAAIRGLELGVSPVQVAAWLVSVALCASFAAMLAGLLARRQRGDYLVAWWLVAIGAALVVVFTTMPDWIGLAPVWRGGVTPGIAGPDVEWGGAPRAAAIAVILAALLALLSLSSLHRMRYVPRLVVALSGAALLTLIVSAHVSVHSEYPELREWIDSLGPDLVGEFDVANLTADDHRLMLVGTTATFLGAWLLIIGAIVDWRHARRPAGFGAAVVVADSTPPPGMPVDHLAGDGDRGADA